MLAECHADAAPSDRDADAALADIEPDAGQYVDGFPKSPTHYEKIPPPSVLVASAVTRRGALAPKRSSSME